MGAEDWELRLAGVEDAGEIAHLLHEFNTEFDVPTPGTDVLAERLVRLLPSANTFSIVAGRPAAGVALVTLRSNVWYEGRVALLDELYVVPWLRRRGLGSRLVTGVLTEARSQGAELMEINVDEGDADALRFYAGHGFSQVDPDSNERALYLSLELG